MTLKLSVFQGVKKTSSTLRQIKDDLGLKHLGCAAFSVNLGKCVWATLPGPLKSDAKKIRHLHHGQTEMSAVTEH
jgi:hypothetical protein